MEHPGREQAAHRLRLEARAEPVAARDEQRASVLVQAAPAEPAQRPREQRGAGRRPELGAEQPEGEVGVGGEGVDERQPGRPVSRPPWRSNSSRVGSGASRSRNAASPSSETLAVGSSVFRYSSPRAASSSPSSACAAPPTQSGCQAEKTSWRNPGTVISALRIAPPSQSFCSSTQTLQPARASSAAQASELMPLPTRTTSKSDPASSPIEEP